MLDLGWGSGDGGRYRDCRGTQKAESTHSVIKERELPGQGSRQLLHFQKGNTVEEEVEGEGQEAALEVLRSRSP